MLYYHNSESKVTLELGAENQVIVKFNNQQIAEFDLLMLWDWLKDKLASIVTTQDDYAGLKRRVYEARNIERLSTEYIKKIFKEK